MNAWPDHLQFGLELLEPRVLLSGNSVLPAAPGMLAVAERVVSGAMVAGHPAADPHAGDQSGPVSGAVQSVFAGVVQEPLAPEAAPPASLADETGGQNQSDTEINPEASSILDGDSAVSVSADTGRGNSNPTTTQLVATLRIGNAPPGPGADLGLSGDGTTTVLTAPTVVSDSINGGLAQRSLVRTIAVTFSTDVSASLSAGTLVLHNVTTNTNVAASAMAESYNSTTNTATWTFPGLTNKALPEGNYFLEIHADAVADVNGTPLAASFTDDFHVLTGDVSGSRVVNDLSLYQVWQNLLKPAAARNLNADLNGDGVVDASDLAVVKSRYLGRLPQSTAFLITDHTPADGATDVGVTVRPEVFFSKPVDPSSLTADDFYATSGGQKLLTTIVPSNDGTFAWLFFSGSMPNASVVQVVVDGSTIRQRGTGTPLDAAGTGVPGSKLTFSFSTVSLAPVVGTSLSGIVVDPGPDLVPRTADDVNPGPTGYTFLLPIAGVKVYILGLESQAQVTGPDGRFHFDSVPVGDVKVVVDGMTATNPPPGYYFPEMVIDASMKIGIDNQVMQGGQVGQEIYLARLKSSILQPVSASSTTTITATSDSAPNLTPAQQQLMSVSIQPGSLVGSDGQKLSTGTVGFSTVPPDLVTDMLPPGVLQHTFDLTIQAPGIATFSTPAPMTFPNVFNAAPGTKLNFLSFDHTTGRLVIEGTATVSADGLSVTTDPGTGVTHPGWHGLTPPGTQTKSPCNPTVPHDVNVDPVPVTAGIGDYFYKDDNGSFTLSFGNAAQLIDPSKDPCDPVNVRATPLVVNITVEGPADEFLNGLASQTLVLEPGEQQSIQVNLKTLLDNIKNINVDRIYGVKVIIQGYKSGSPTPLLIDQKMYVYRYLDAADDNHTDGIVWMPDTTNDGAAGIMRQRPIEYHTSASAQPTLAVADTTNFSNVGFPNNFIFDPTVTGDNLSTSVQVKDPDGNVAGTLTIKGDGVILQWYVDTAALKTALTNIANGTLPGATAAEQALIDTDAKRQAVVDAVISKTEALMNGLRDAGPDGVVGTADDGGWVRVTASTANSVNLNVFSTPTDCPATGSCTLGDAYLVDNGSNGGIAALVANRANYSVAEQNYRLSEVLNEQYAGHIDVYVNRYFSLRDFATLGIGALENALAKTFAHEIGHNVGLNHTAGGGTNIGVAGATTDVMAQGLDTAGALAFSTTTNAYNVAIGNQWTSAQAQKAIDYFAAYINTVSANFADGTAGQPLPPDHNDVEGGGVDGDGGVPPIGKGVLHVVTAADLNYATNLNFGTVPVDGPGGNSATENLLVENVGDQNLTLSSFVFQAGSSSSIQLSTTIPAGTVLAPHTSTPFSVTFDPLASGDQTATLLIGNNGTVPTYEVDFEGFGLDPNGDIQVAAANNNLGGTAVGGAGVTVNGFATIQNIGASALTITNIIGSSEYTVSGLPANFGPTNPLTVAPGHTYSLNLTFDPSVTGLRRADIQVFSNDADTPVYHLYVTGTGLAATGTALHYGNDFVAVDTPDLPGSPVLRTVSDAQGNWSVFLPPNQPYHYVIFDPISGLVAHGYGVSSASGRDTHLTAPVFKASTAVDTDGDGLPDDVEFAIGTSPTKADTDNSGIDDFTAVMEGLDPLGGRGFPTGVIASLALQGEAQDLVVAGSPNDAQGQTAFVATGTYGLAIVDVSQFNKPVVLGQLQLPGDSTGVAVDLTRNLAVVANSSGLDFVDISNFMNPVLNKTVSLPLGPTRVLVFDGVAYATSNTSLVAIDLTSGETIQTLNLGGQPLTDIAREGSMLYTMDSGKTLRAVDISNFNMVADGSLALPDGGGRLFVGNGIAYVAATSNFRGGFDTVNVSNPNSLTLIAGSQVSQTSVAPNTAIVANGSGLGIAIGVPSRTNTSVLDLMNVSDPTNTNAFLTRFNLPASPNAVTLAEGIAFVADGTSGLQVVNYLGFDTKGQAPTVSISSPITGTQAIEGTSIPITVHATDDVQVRNVELLVNGSVVANAVSFPYDFVADVPKLTPTVTSVAIQVRATDTGGNDSLSNLLSYTLMPDTVPPAIVSTNPTASQKIFFTPSIDVLFSKPLDASILSLTGVTLTFLGPSGNVNVPISSLQMRNLDRKLSVFPATSLDTGNYQLTLDPSVISDRVGNHLASAFTLPFTIRAASDVQALVGTPAVPRAPSANVGQTIGFYIPGATSSTALTFPTVDSNGNIGSRQVTVSSIDAATSTAFFVVPPDATTGNFTLPNDPNGPFILQIVPTLVRLQASVGNAYYGNNLRLRGSGFVAGSVTINFGTQALTSTSTSNPQVGYFYAMPNDGISLTVPNGVPFGPISVTTPGGTSPSLNLTLSGIVSTATSGTPADPTQASANPGQAIVLQGNGLDLNTNVVFPVVDGSGNLGQRVVQPVLVNAAGTQATVLVPADGISGQVGVVGDRNNNSVLLQLIPVILGADFTSVTGDGSSAQVRLHGAGFVKGNNSVYTFGTVSVTDTTTPPTSINVGYYYSQPNDGVNLTLAMSNSVYGAVRVKTAGGTSAPFSVGLSGIDNLAGTGLSVALSGTPADGTQASANPGQAVELAGSGLSGNSGVVMEYIDGNGTVQTQLLHPSVANLAGTAATVVVPGQYNGAFAVHVLGSSGGPLLQIVPLLTGVNVTGPDAVRLHGAGFVEGNNSVYVLGSGSVTDTSSSGSPIDVYYGSSYDNDTVNIGNVAVSGVGVASVKTMGGTSATLTWNIVNPDKGTLYDVAVEAGGNLWVASDTLITRINPGTGATLASYNMPGGSSGNVGLEILPVGMSLFGVAVPAGSLLVSNGSANKVYAVSVTDGTTLATLALGQVTVNGSVQGINPVGGVYDSVSGHLFLLSAQGGGLVVEVDPATGTVVNQFGTPIGINYGGLAIDPVDGNLWIGSSQTNVLEQVSKTGKVVGPVDLDLAGQGIDHEISGLAFNGMGQLVASSNHGMVYTVVKLASGVGTPTISGINGLALDGSAANGSFASANVGQVIEVVGANFTGNTRVIFPTRDNNGVVGKVVVTPNVVSADGTRLQVTVPDQATTGGVTLSTIPTLVNLGFGGWADAIYRGITLTFTAGSPTAAIRFADGGLQGLSDESWGIDNVVVTPAGSPGTVLFADDFEAGAKPQWSSGQTDGSEPAFTRFSGRFSNGSQTLNLSGLTAGAKYAVKFDFYAIDSWDGDSGGGVGPDYFIVTADSQVLMKETFANFPNDTQSFRGFDPGSVGLQVVPVISGLNGRPGGTDVWTLQGSGFMEGASTIQVGGVVYNDGYTNTPDDKVSGQRNSSYALRIPGTLEGPISVTTAGGTSVWAGPVLTAPAFVALSGISGSAAYGVAADPSKASANAGQTIVLTGSGFTGSTLVQFEAVDSTGAVGTLTRTGNATNNGTQLSVVVPGMARSGQVRVVGASGSVYLAVVPVVRSVGGTIAAGQAVVLEGSGLVAGALTVTVDGQGVSGVKVSMISDAGLPQQVVDLTVPAGVSAGVITVSTAGGSDSFRRGVTISAGTDVSPGTDVGETLATALGVVVPLNTRLNVAEAIGNNAFAAKDVDMYSLNLTGGDVLTLDVARLTSTLSGTYLRLFDSNGNQLAADSSSGGAPTYDSRISNWVVPASGTYYVGVSSAGNYNYNPTTANSGSGGSYTGNYKLSVQRVDGGSSSLSGITASAGSGTAARAGVAAANVGQTITLTGSGLSNNDQVVFETRDGNGTVGTIGVSAASVAADGSSMTVVVPAAAASGMVRLGRESAGIFLQVVPTLVGVDPQSGGYHNGYLRLHGSGFMDGALVVNFGNMSESSSGVYGTPGAGYYYSQANDGISLTVPNGVPLGPISVTTLGGTTAALNLSLSGITSTATSGTPANPAQASANPGQTITLQGSGFTAKTAIVFLVVDAYGNVSERIVNPATAAADGTGMTVSVPNDAITGVVNIIGDKNSAPPLLQIVPVVNSARVTGVDTVQLKGGGFVKGNNSVYTFGATSAIDVSSSTEGFSISNSSQPNDTANLALRISGPGNVTVTTAGGTSAPIAWNAINPDHGNLYGTAYDATSGSVWVAGYSQIYRVNASNGQTTATFAMPGGNSNNVGLQIVPAGLTLAGTAVPAGSLLVTNGAPNPDKVFALNATTGAVIASLTLSQNFDAVGGLFDSASGHLFILHSSEVVEVNPADGTVISKFASPIGIGAGGLAFDPTTGNIWIGSTQGNSIVLVTKTGTTVRTVDLTAQGISQEVSGLAFNSAGQLLVSSSSRGVVFVLNPP